jgi:hypothetical protein
MNRVCSKHGRKKRDAYKILVAKHEGKKLVGIDGIILKWLLKKYVGRVWAGFCIRTGTSGRIL